MSRRIALIVIFTAGLLLRTAEAKTIRVLTVGNSFSHNATHCLGDLANAAGDTLILREVNIGGSSFDIHLKKAEVFEKDPTANLGRYTSGKGLKEELASDQWDFITIQQSSIKSHDVETYRPFAKQLADYIRQHAPGATLMLHQTWEYRIDDPRFAVKEPKPGEPKTQDEMYAGLAGAYATIAKELGLRLIPVGDAFHAANRDSQWGFRPLAKPFEAKAAKPGELPVQSHSLNVGWNWKKQLDGSKKLIMDGHHASAAGEYLGACVWYEILFGLSVENVNFAPPGLDADYAKFLRATAHRAAK